MLDDIPALFLNETEARQSRSRSKNSIEFIRQFVKQFELKTNPNYNEFEKICAI